MMSPRTRFLPVATIATALVLLAAGCSTSKTPTASSSAPAPSRAASSPASPSPSPAAVMDAAAVVHALSAQGGLPMTKPATQNEDNDPNNLLGRPGQYTSRASFDVTGGETDAKTGEIERGGVVEVFTTADEAKSRADFIQKALASNNLGTEYEYQAGPVLLRISGKIKPSVATKFKTALAAIG